MSEGAVQCGFCTPGMIMNAKALLEREPAPSEIDIKTAISGVLCRCTGYNKIVQAVKTAKNWETKPTGNIKEPNIRTNNCQEKLSEAKKIALRLQNSEQFEAHHHVGQHHFYIFEVT